METSSFSRREFIRSSATAAAIAAASPAMFARASAGGPNERLRIGFIGLGGPQQGRCQTHLESACRLQNEVGNVEVAAVCDVFNRYRDAAVEKVREATKKAPTTTGDYREI